MTEQYMLVAINGAHNPRYTHNDLREAVKEATRLSVYLNTEVKILRVIGKVERKDIPVVRRESVVVMNESNDELPF